MRGTGLRPYLEPLDSGERAAFLEAFERAVAEQYPAQADGRVLFPFPRLFAIAYV
jgi:trans-aconitate 2-methyltransferase